LGRKTVDETVSCEHKNEIKRREIRNWERNKEPNIVLYLVWYWYQYYNIKQEYSSDRGLGSTSTTAKSSHGMACGLVVWYRYRQK
jgi:hypothetical protein